MTSNSDNSELQQLLFGDLVSPDCFGYGKKRIAVNINGSITDKVPLRAYGYKDKNNKYYVCVRLYYDQGNYSKSIEWDPNYTIKNHLTQLVYNFEKEYGSNLM